MNEWTLKELDIAVQWKRSFCLYIYTPMCGTCQVAGRMLDVSLELLPDLEGGKVNLNYVPQLADRYAVESVPCLLIFKEGVPVHKIYAFQSVPYLYEQLKNV